MRHQALSCHLLWHQALFLMEEKQELIQSSQHLHQVKVSTFGIKLGEKENVTTEFSHCHLHLLSFSYSVHPVHYYKQNAKKHSQSTTADYRSPFTLLQRTKQTRLLILLLKKGCRELKIANISYRSYWWHRNNIRKNIQYCLPKSVETANQILADKSYLLLGTPYCGGSYEIPRRSKHWTVRQQQQLVGTLGLNEIVSVILTMY